MTNFYSRKCFLYFSKN